jgi:hypothetical protein
MPMNRIQFQHGMSLPEFLRSFGTEEQCAAAVAAARWPDGYACPRCAASAYWTVKHQGRELFPVRELPSSDVVDRRHGVRQYQAAADDMVPGHLPAQPGQDRAVGAGAQAPARRELPHRLADSPQDPARHGSARADAPPRGDGADRRRPTSVVSAVTARPVAALRARHRSWLPSASTMPAIRCMGAAHRLPVVIVVARRAGPGCRRGRRFKLIVDAVSA